MKNIFLAFLLFAGTTVMAQSGSMKAAPDVSATKSESVTKTMGKEEIQKSLALTDAEADKVWAIQQKYCGPDVKASAKQDAASRKETASMDKQHEAYYAALLEVIPAKKAEKLMEECKMTCEMGKAKADATSGKGCCAGSAEKKSCSDKKK
ncbi:hypothetical protein G3O08_11775 [Cryomorpha ignava]|uniref:DUF3347 domain-containing protein n=1 Tax=Cryomorpha ignava TaxID=101383 RepID=A0A7K3WT02_9FLAO|nr:hypothetical protein [Cryomorpha ignava]NEN24181.1 hypothetical protein [Cryomorpha ignava]